MAIIRHEAKQHFYLTDSQTLCVVSEMRVYEAKSWQTHTLRRRFSAPFILSLLLLVIATLLVQFRASVIVVCILYFDKTFIYEKPRQ